MQYSKISDFRVRGTLSGWPIVRCVHPLCPTKHIINDTIITDYNRFQ